MLNFLTVILFDCHHLHSVVSIPQPCVVSLSPQPYIVSVQYHSLRCSSSPQPYIVSVQYHSLALFQCHHSLTLSQFNTTALRCFTVTTALHCLSSIHSFVVSLSPQSLHCLSSIPQPVRCFIVTTSPYVVSVHSPQQLRCFTVTTSHCVVSLSPQPCVVSVQYHSPCIVSVSPQHFGFSVIPQIIVLSQFKSPVVQLSQWTTCTSDYTVKLSVRLRHHSKIRFFSYTTNFFVVSVYHHS